MGKKGALVLLVTVLLWAATPALACLVPVAHRSCCQQMEMQDCSSSAMMQCDDCCSVHPVDMPLLPGSAVTVDHAVGFMPAPGSIALALPADEGSRILSAAEAQLEPGSPGAGSVLRI